MLVGIKKHIGRLQARRDRIADAAQIDDMDPANPTIERNMGMPDDDQVRLAASQPLLQLVIAVLGLETGSVVSAWEAWTPSKRVLSGKVKRTSSGKFVSQSSQPAAPR